MTELSRRITGTHVYGYLHCPRAVALDLHLDRELRRPPTEWEEFARRRGRDFEASVVAGIDCAEPAYPERDFEAGAAATLGLLREAAPWVFQGVLLGDGALGIPDLLRAVPGPSALGDHHYEVVDVKSSGQSRADQILQVAFYSALLAALQERPPEHGALILKDGHEERFPLRDYAPALAEVERRLGRLRGDVDAEPPFRSFACASCHWNHRCLPEMEAADDLSLVHGMTRGARTALQQAGCATAADLATGAPDALRARSRLEAPLLRRLRTAAQARVQGAPIPQRRPAGAPLDPGAIVHLLRDPYAERVLFLGVRHPDGALRWALPPDRAAEWADFQELVRGLPAATRLLHFGRALPHWYEEQAWAREAGLGLESAFVDLQRRLLGAAVYPGPVFGLDDLVRYALGVDPHRYGHASAAASWLEHADGAEKLVAKGCGDLDDLWRLKAEWLTGGVVGPEP